MATRSQGRCVNPPDVEYLDGSDADVFYHQKPDNVVEALVKGVSSIPLQRHAAFVPVMPPEITESFLRSPSPPPSPTPVRVSQKDIKPLTSKRPSDQYSKECIASIASSLAPSPLTSLPLHVSQEDAKPLKSRKSSKQSSKEPASGIPLLFPPSAPLASRTVPKDTKPLTSGKQSCKDSNDSGGLSLPTPDKTSSKRSRRKNTKVEVKLERSPSPEIPETPRQVTELKTGYLITPPLTRLRPLRHRKEARESNLSEETALDVAEVPEIYHHGRNTGSPVSVLSAKVNDSQQLQFKDNDMSSTTKLEDQRCCTAFQDPCMRKVWSAQLCHLHKPASNNSPVTPQSVSRYGMTRRSSVQCKEEVPITPGQFTNSTAHYPSNFPTGLGRVSLEHVDDKQFKVKRPGRKDVFVAFCDHIPPYLQPETQKKLRAAITKALTGRDRVPGYIYTLNVTDPRRGRKLSLKVGCSENVKKRHKEWQKQCPSYIGDIRGCWPGPVDKPKYPGESLIGESFSANQQCPPGLIAAVRVERLVHIELADLARHAPYLRPNFPNISYADVPPMEKAQPIFCTNCVSARTGRGTEHREIFSFRRAEEGAILGTEWECIIEPVIRRWGLFGMKYFTESA